jgi:hypothetical protein
MSVPVMEFAFTANVNLHAVADVSCSYQLVGVQRWQAGSKLAVQLGPWQGLFAALSKVLLPCNGPERALSRVPGATVSKS